MLAVSRHRAFSKIKQITIRRYAQVALSDENEYTETPNYPPIQDMSLQARKLRDRETIYENIKNINTVEEKQIGLNMPKYYGWPCVMLNENVIPYNAMPLVQYYTRTYFKLIDKLPDIYNETSDLADSIVKEIKSHIEDCILIENEGVQRNINLSTAISEEQQKEDALAKNVVRQINRIITNNITDKVPHILSSQVDYDPRVEAFWFMGGTDVPQKVVNYRYKFPWLKKRLHEPIDRPIQYIGSPILTLRNHLPLKPLVPYSEVENPKFKVAKFKHVPESVGYFVEFRHGTNIPGYWPGDLDEFGLLSYHNRGHILCRKQSYGPQDNLEALHCQAMKASFGWLLGQANYQGFTSYNDMTYPLTTQTVITNGHLISLYAYQLNTIAMNIDKVDNNLKHNICFGTQPMKLYEKIEDGKVHDLNEDTLKMLVQFYLNAPEEREHEMKPYLGKEEQLVSDIEDDNKRCWLEARYKHLMSNRPRHNLLPEIYHWEKIYKIQHQTRFFEAKRRPFEFGISPYKRRLDEHLPTYIPKVLRPYPKARKKFETTYYPKV
ncbi:28S ribosomal protein S30, mitochondrial [Zerene cesonia]|uniref:28S ribosomal protein S30, mitochondrial n=1 Tax=Zerene cesonia TaxID=33412 RepID=UPI0018E5582C|nr:28S ribosomal protein S30, mitochondrial [Zerene cesonia]